MKETFCCMVCRLLQDRSFACVECGAPNLISLEAGAEALKYGDLSLANTGATRREKVANVAGGIGILGAYAGAILGSALWWPAIPIALAAGAGGVGALAWFNRAKQLAPVPELPVLGDGVAKTGIARKLGETVKSLAGEAVLVEQHVITKGGVLLRRTTSVPFLVDLDGERLVVTGVVRVTSKPIERKLKKGDPILAALGIPPAIPVAGRLATAIVRDGDRVTVTGVLATEMVPELAFHRDAGESSVMRGAARSVVAIQTSP